MKKKVFSLMMALTLGLFGLVRAQDAYEAQIGNGNGTSGYFPFYTLYNYSIGESLFLASELQDAGASAGPVTSLSWYATNQTGDAQQGLSIWLANVSDTQLTNVSHSTTGMTLVYTGSMTPATGWNEFTFNQGEFEWDGTSNLLVFFQRNNGNWGSTVYWQTTGTSFTSMAYKFQDSGAYNVTSEISGMSTGVNRANIIIKGVGGGSTPGGGGSSDDPEAGLHVRYDNGEEGRELVVDSLYLGEYPAGAWMEPFSFQMYNDDTQAYTVSVLDFTPNTDALSMVEGIELPFTVAGNSAEYIDLAIQVQAPADAEAGDYEYQFVAIYEGSRLAKIWPLSFTIYTPEVPDVVEKAYDLGTIADGYTYTGVPSDITPTVLHNDYTLPFPEIPEGNDAVYKFKVEGDMIISAYVDETNADGKVAIYTEDFNGEAGPMAHNNYTGFNSNTRSVVCNHYGTLQTQRQPRDPQSEYKHRSANANGNQGNIATVLNNRGSQTYGICCYNDYESWPLGFINFDIDDPTTVSALNSDVYEYFGLDYCTADQYYYAYDYYEGILVKMDLDGNIVATVGPLIDDLTDGAWNATNNTMYAIYSTTLYTVDLSNGDLYTLATSTSSFRGIACNADGQLYAVMSDGNLYTVDATTGAQTLVGATGYYPYYAQSLQFDQNTGNLYWCFTDDYSDNFMQVNPATGAATLLLADTGETTGLCFPVTSTPTPSPLANVGPVIEDMPITAGTYYLVASSTDADYTVYINAADMPCPAIDADGFAFNPQPADDQDSIQPASVTLTWTNPEYATGWRLVFGSTYYPEAGHPQTVIYPADGSFSTEMANSYTVTNLWNNTNYFWHVEFNNGACEDGVSSPIWGFTTTFNAPRNLVATPNEIFEGDSTVLTWNAIVDRTYRQYRVYQDGVMIHEFDPTTNPEANLTYTVTGLTYNPTGYVFNVTAVYDEGESPYSNDAIVKVSGFSAEPGIFGYVYEQDSVTPIGGVTVTVTGTDEFGNAQTHSATTNAEGYYSINPVEVGTYATAEATCNGYVSNDTPYTNWPPITIAYQGSWGPMNFILQEVFYPSPLVCAETVQVGDDELVKVWWQIPDGTGDSGNGNGNGGDPGDVILTQDFESGLGDWTMSNCLSSTGVLQGTSYPAHSGNYHFCFHWTTNPPQYLISPELNGTGSGVTVNFFYKAASTYFVEKFHVGYSTTTNDPAAFTFGEEITSPDVWTEYTNSFPAGTKYVAIKSIAYDAFYLFIDDITITAGRAERDMTADRAMHHYRIYRTDCYYEGPYYEGDPGGTVVLASAWVPDTAYFDVSWPDAAPGVYKWGVGVVYEGNQADNPNNPRNRDEITEGFEGVSYQELPEGWTSIDADGDGNDWYTLNWIDAEWDENVAHGGDTWATSASYAGIGALYPDNYLVSPQVALGGSITFWACAQDASWAGEKFGVAVSTTGNTNAADFTTLQSWTMTAKATGAKTSDTRSGSDRAGAWYQYTVDLSAYAGQTGYVAIRHYDCTDMFRLNVDDITITTPGGVTPTPTPTPTPGNASCNNLLALPRESCTAWSNDCYGCIDKDMDIPSIEGDQLVSINVLLNSADPHSPDGTTVKFTNLHEGEQANHPQETITLMDSPYHEFETFRRGTYAIEIAHLGYYTIFDTVNIGVQPNPQYQLRYVMEEILYPAREFYVSYTGFAMWSMESGWENGRNDRHFEYYKVMCTSIDGQPIFNVDVTTPYCQLATDQLTEDETYICKVAAVFSTGISEWRETEWVYRSCENYAGTANGVTINGNTISWDYPGTVTPTPDPTPDPTPGEGLTEGFEGGLGDWTNIDADGDGNVWMTGRDEAHTGTGYAESESYINYVGALTPDNYLVSPQVTLGGTFTFWASAQDPSYAAEKFGVAVSTAGNTNAADFTTLQSWTMTSKSTASTKAAVRGGTRAGTWYQYSVDLSAYAGQTGYVAIRHYDCTDQFILNVDDIELVNGGVTPTPTPTPTPVEGIIGAAIYQNGQPIDFVMAPTNTWEMPESGEYCVRIIYDGPMDGSYYSMSCEECEGDEVTCTADFTFNGAYDWNEGEYQAHLWWGVNDDPTPDPDPTPGEGLTEGFEGVAYTELPEGWTSIDADGDGNDWYTLNWIEAQWDENVAHGGDTWATSASYASGALYPDNYLVSPQVALGGTFTFWACAQDASWAGEKFGVAVSTTGNTNAADFTTLQSWTMTAKATGAKTSDTRSGSDRAGAWYQYTVDLSAYAGQTGYVAIRHYDCSDMFRLNVDDIELTVGRGARSEIVAYNVYSSVDGVNYTQIGTVDAVAGQTYYEYFDNTVTTGSYYYQVTAVYADGCESAPVLVEGTTNDYLVLNITNVGENNGEVALFPNPTSGNVKIMANAMRHITVVSVLGQVVYDADVNADEMDLNMGQWNAGVYVVRIVTETGINTQRVTVVR